MKDGEPNEKNLSPSATMMTEKKRGRNVGSKNKKLLSQGGQPLKLTFGELQGMLRPPPNAKPNVVVVDGFEFEEYDEPPVFGKPSVFTARSTGEKEQWAQCDNCSKWRRIPVDFLLSVKWTCADNEWDPDRCFCSAPEESIVREVELLSKKSKGYSKKQRKAMDDKMQKPESSCVNPLVNTPGVGDNLYDQTYSQENNNSSVVYRKMHLDGQHECEDGLQTGLAQANDGQGQNPLSKIADYDSELDEDNH